MLWSWLTMTLLMITGIFLILIILLQRGRGGGLAGAFGGLGGQSAFGTKAGDVFTKITIGLAVFWIFLAGISGLALERDSERRFVPAPTEETIVPGDSEPESDAVTPPPTIEPGTDATKVDDGAAVTDSKADADKKATGEADKKSDQTGASATEPTSHEKKPADAKQDEAKTNAPEPKTPADTK